VRVYIVRDDALFSIPVLHSTTAPGNFTEIMPPVRLFAITIIRRKSRSCIFGRKIIRARLAKSLTVRADQCTCRRIARHTHMMAFREITLQTLTSSALFIRTPVTGCFGSYARLSVIVDRTVSCLKRTVVPSPAKSDDPRFQIVEIDVSSPFSGWVSGVGGEEEAHAHFRPFAFNIRAKFLAVIDTRALFNPPLVQCIIGTIIYDLRQCARTCCI